jgi:hypothetical protein
MNGPRPSEVVQRVMALEKAGAYIVQGNTDIAVADLDFSAAFLARGRPPSGRGGRDPRPASGRGLDWLRRLPAERRIRAEGLLVPFATARRAARPRGCRPTWTRPPSSASRAPTRGSSPAAHPRGRGARLGRRLICNPGSCGFAFRRRRGRGSSSSRWTATRWARSPARLRPAPDRRRGGRGLPGDVYRAATIRTGRLVR